MPYTYSVCIQGNFNYSLINCQLQYSRFTKDIHSIMNRVLKFIFNKREMYKI